MSAIQPDYSKLSIAMHWLMLLVLAAVYTCIECREFFPKGSDPRETLKQLHFMLGLSVFVLVSVRIAARLVHPVAPIEPALPRWQAHSAQVLHLALYALMIAMPIIGWLILSAEGKPVPFFGATLPPLIGESESIAECLEEIHETVGQAGYFLIGLHAGAALIHHYVLHDGVLARMWPARR